MKLVLGFVLIFSCGFSVAQTSLIDRLHEMQQNPILKEKVYLHTNKTSYFPDDVIWFKAYVGDSINYPSVRSKVLEVGLFDLKGNPLFAEHIAITEGTGVGQFELNDAIAPGSYYLQARTNYMRNFGEEHHYTQDITILGQALPNLSTQEHKAYDVQFLPESGNLIEDVENVLGIKALFGDRSIDFKGIITTKKGVVVTSFQSEHAGLSSCTFIYGKGETYTAKIQVKDTLLEYDIPKALAKGVSLNVDNSDNAYLKVTLKTNKATFSTQISSKYTLLYQQNRQLIGLFSIGQFDSLTAALKTKKNIFLDGVNTVTLFANDRPIAQRKFYIETNRKKAGISLEKSKIDTDSTTYILSSKGKMKNRYVNLSISVLQKNAEALAVKNTIRSAFLLRPYVGGYIENPAYYFKTENKKRKEHLDLLLLTQGWTGYTLNEMIEAIRPIEKFSFETGFELKGSISDAVPNKNLVLIPNTLRVIDKVALGGKSEFAFQNLNVFKGDTVRVAYQDGSGKISKPAKIVYDTILPNIVSKGSVSVRRTVPKTVNGATSSFDTPKTDGSPPATDSSPLGTVDGIIDLDEVTVTERKRSEKYVARRKLIKKYEPLVRNIGQYYNLPFSKASGNYDIGLLDFLELQGFRLWTGDNIHYFLIDPITLNNFRGPKLGFLYIDGRPVAPEELRGLQLKKKDVDNIMVSNTNKPISIFQVFTSASYRRNTAVLFDKFIISNGFDSPQKYYTPLYVFERSRPANFLEVDWKPEVRTNTKGEVSFKIATSENDKELLFWIQGFSNEGHLISKTIQTD